MRAAGWLAAVLCPLALLGAGSRGLRFHPGQETLVKRLSSYEIVTPVRVNEFGEAFPRTHHFSRRKRSSGDPPQPLAFRTHYQLAAYGQVFQLNLSADAAFIAAQYTTVHVGAPREQVTPDLRHCFYRGHVNAQEAHMAVFSICGGLMGTFKTHDGEYFLEPLMKMDGGEHEDEHNKPHLIYRHEEFNKKYQKSHKPCEVSENKLKESTLLHPDFSNLNEEKNVLQNSPSIEYAFKNLSLKAGGNNPHSRKKRFLSYPRYVEVMVTADTKMVRHHGQNLQHYILTLMSIVAAIYKDSSIGNLINIVIVKLIVIHNEQEGPAITFNAATTLRNFCLWQQAQNTLDDAHPSHHDTAVLITREDICRAREKCDTLGLAELGTMCDPLRSCSISEENGLSAAFTIAHELGHVFNVPHDDSFKCKEAGIKHQYHVMAPTLNYHTSPWTWSKCSQKYITEFLDTGYGECLLDKPSGRIYDLSSQLPGSMYDVNKQCELMFGLGSQVCPYLKQCKRLWCTSTEGVHKGCRTQHMPLADGTVCGVGMHCRHGICVSRDMETRPVDGEWGPWGPYSSCSRTCGGGIKSTTRLCNRPEAKKISGSNSALNLMANTLTSMVLRLLSAGFQNTVVQAGCDHVLNSKARRDKCGICGGDNSSCKTLAGYNVVVKIPKGATNIDIRQHSYSGKPEDDNYLALSDIHGNFILNGNFVVSMSKREINIQGAIFEYNGSNNTIERINSTDRIEEELTLQVLCVGNLYNPDVRYSFNIPIEDRSELFTWDPYGPWQDCSRMCRGIRRRRMTCIRKSDHAVVSDQRCEFIPPVPDVSEECNTECELRWHSIGKSDCTSKCGPGYRSIEIRCMKYSVSKGLTAPVDDRYCADQQKPPTREPCHGDCMLTSWHYTEWSECSRSCERGVRTREAFCLNNLGRHLPDRECQELPRVVTQSCNEFLCPSWSVSEWSECPVTCGKGIKHRQVWCQLNDEQLRDDFCNPNDRPGSVTPCELHECASWQVGPWGSCTVTCGRGYQMRAVKCVTGTYRVILDDDRECNAATRPRDNQECELPACPETTKLWTTSLPLIHVGKVTQWRYGSWTPCSASCGKGDRARYVSCRDAHGGIADESFCAHLPRPAEVSSCFSPCGEWQVGNWSPCTVTCDSGTVTRQVICVNYHQQINENYCDPEGRPSKERECNMPPCPPVYHHTPRIHDRPSNFPEIGYLPIHHPQDNTNQWNHPSVGGYQWRTGPWGACSSTCAGGFHRRVVVCQDEEGRSASYCDEATKPPESRHCDSGPCPRWNYGNWGECTQTCGDGIKTRLVICQLPTGQMLGDQNCEILDKPPNMAQCNVHSCPGDVSWHRGPWKSCSVSCGKGLKYRDVHCFNSFQAKIEEGNCRHLKKPRTYKICRAGRCPAWKASRWKECSVSCGVGIQQRDIYCQLKGLGQVNEAACNHAARPTSQRRCWLPACMQYHWLADEWEDCSTSYRREEIHRKVKCVDENQIQVDESFCDPATKPPSTKNCRIAPTKYVVLTGDLSQCSASCGVDYRQRITYCVGIHSVQNKHAYGLRTVAYQECPVTPSPYIYTCNIKGCSQGATWRVGKWTKCSVTCGVGVKERTVACMTENGLSSDLCLPRLKPDTRKICHAEECEILSTCKDIQVKKGIRKDGEYLLNIKGRMIKIYCSGMHLENPREYVTLVKGEADNFSEVYGFRLQNPYECPFNGSRRQDCACRNDYLAAGFTIFSKIRFDVDSMQIRTTDFLFAQTILGRAVPFATAGDCYSAARCPQGQFSINLAGTGLRLSSTVRWIAQGNYATADIHKSHDGTKIYGRCGGFCGKCIPNTITGLQLQIQ
ncbi:A disintegrin and metalloproteinase with thrombospondin motifs 20 isoform X6 [Anas acuta]|uniref:A disintegrin and metalloproteinase with thrombospondin motifs 20 isoform X6 n=1 Tax=Anas acuta TaxID=28680 RepID=UPI0035C8B3C0